jgi:predicted metal-dependent peptidase
MTVYDHFPYLAPYIYSLTPVERPGIGTMAVDKYGRLYYDPDFCDKITLEEGGYVVCHEGWHLILRHCHRSESIVGDRPSPQDLRNLNIAMDIVVWEMMEAIAHLCPEGGVTYPKAKEQWPKIERNMTVEQLYSIISEPPPKPPVPPPPPPKPPKGEDEGGEGEDEGTDPGDPSEQEESEDGDGGGKPEDSEGDAEGDGKGGEGDSEGDGKGDGEGKGKGKGGDFELIGGGSAGDGQPKDYEEEPDPKWDAFIEDNLLEAVENKVEQLEADRDWVSGRGTIPSELKRIIKNKLHPQPNPWDRLRATVAKAAANHRGVPDYTYHRPNRRQSGVELRLKGQKKYSPKAVVIIDTSGSMTPGCLAKALVVIKQGLKAIGNVPVITCDARVHQDQMVSAVQDTFELVGGGGTDMRVPLAYSEEKYKPDVTVLVTDTGTPWPDQKLKGQLIVAATQDGHVPDWAVKVRIPDSPNKEEL